MEDKIGKKWDAETGRKLSNFESMEQLRKMAAEILGDQNGIMVEHFRVDGDTIDWASCYLLRSGGVEVGQDKMTVTDQRPDNRNERVQILLSKEDVLGVGVQIHEGGTKSLLVKNRVEQTIFVWRMTKMVPYKKGNV